MNVPVNAPEETKPGATAANSGHNPDTSPENRSKRVAASALWAAYADALGFITELASEEVVRRRVGELPDHPIPWKRRIGGRGGPTVELPAGCYSDDTQLRLCVSRSMSPIGFDVEAFARVELPVWPAYALGGGIASKKAAAGFTRQNMDWYANFYDGWTQAGGNGAAMRIQPHIWAAPDLATVGRADVDVVLDSITTHGHPRAIVGAVLHGRSLAFALHRGRVADVREWRTVLSEAASVLDLLEEHHPWSTVWRSRWEAEQGGSFRDAWKSTVAECVELLDIAETITEGSAAVRYAALTQRIGLAVPERRGSGTLGAVAALVLASWTNADPRAVARISAHSLGTDTDTIGTMAAAIAGAVTGGLPERESVLDFDYLSWEADRLARIACSKDADRFHYPDLLDWQAPRTQADCFGLADGQLALAGVGLCVESGTSHSAAQMRWRWVRTEFEQTLIVKSRVQLPNLPKNLWPASQDAIAQRDTRESHAREGSEDRLTAAHGATEPARLMPDGPVPSRGPAEHSGKESGESTQLSLDTEDALFPETESSTQHRIRAGEDSLDNVAKMLDWVARNGFTDASLGYAIRRLSQVGTLEQVIAFVALAHEALAGVDALRDPARHPRLP